MAFKLGDVYSKYDAPKGGDGEEGDIGDVIDNIDVDDIVLPETQGFVKSRTSIFKDKSPLGKKRTSRARTSFKLN